ncbi:MAG: long-chain fatty acid--CoA ligase [Verrucomicrobiales bacterium]|nr:long-chain fatty acid--CoA ligase [Verrucomicrobiales bacterium]
MGATGLDELAASLISAIERGFEAAHFETLALELFALQYERNPAYRALCAASRATPGSVRDWTQIPHAPAAAFKELELTSLAPEQRTHVFHSSGTTGQRCSRHVHGSRSLALYEASLLASFEPHLLPESRGARDVRIVALTPAPSEAPHSSLAHMLERVMSRFGGEGSCFVGRVDSGGAWQVDPARLWTQLNAEEGAAGGARPVVMLGTAFGLVHLCDGLRELGLALELPPGSRVMETGGYKGRSRELDPEDLHRLVADTLGVGREWIVREYGMSELSSQAYDRRAGESGAGGRFHFPAWARARAISPETGRECAPGVPGLLRVWDLANVYSVAVLQTEDRVVADGAGFRVLGRAQTVEPRGCSLMSP